MPLKVESFAVPLEAMGLCCQVPAGEPGCEEAKDSSRWTSLLDGQDNCGGVILVGPDLVTGCCCRSSPAGAPREGACPVPDR